MAQRANGEGSIYQRKDGRWVAGISIGGTKRKHFFGRTRGEVAKKLADALNKQSDGLPVKFERQLFAGYAAGWLNDAKTSVSPRTWTRYEQLVRCHCVPALGKFALEKVTPQHLQRLYSDVAAAGAMPGTVVQVHAVLHRMFKQALKWNLVPRNPAAAVTRPKNRRQEMKTLSPEQVRKLLEAAKGDRLEALYVLGVTTGMRQGEMLGLRWKDVDREHGMIHLQASLQRTATGYEFVQPKTSRSRRQVMLTAVAIDALERHRVSQTAERLVKGSAWENKDDLVFTNLTGGPLDGTHLLRHCFRPLLKRAGLPEIRFHDLRHTAATLLLGQGIHPKIVSEMLGHSTVNITLDLYSHVTPTMQREAAKAIDRVLAASQAIIT
jgi:integrase